MKHNRRRPAGVNFLQSLASKWRKRKLALSVTPLLLLVLLAVLSIRGVQFRRRDSTEDAESLSPEATGKGRDSGLEPVESPPPIPNLRSLLRPDFFAVHNYSSLVTPRDSKSPGESKDDGLLTSTEASHGSSFPLIRLPRRPSSQEEQLLESQDSLSLPVGRLIPRRLSSRH